MPTSFLPQRMFFSTLQAQTYLVNMTWRVQDHFLSESLNNASLIRMLYYYIDTSVLLGTKPLVDSIRHCIRDPSGVFSV